MWGHLATTSFTSHPGRADRSGRRTSPRRTDRGVREYRFPSPPGWDLKLNQVNLASDIPGMAPLTDPDLKNPWGISLSPTSPLWVSNQGTNSSTLYTLTPGSSTVTKVPTVRVTMGGSVAGPTGQVANTGTRIRREQRD